MANGAGMFNRNTLKEYLDNCTLEKVPNYLGKREKLSNWINCPAGSETQLEPTFLTDIFRDILGYAMPPTSGETTLIPKQKTDADRTVPDGTIGFFVEDGERLNRGVIELKGPETDLDKKQPNYNQTPVEQAFGYAPKNPGCRWVIVSNMREIRLYKSTNQLEYEKFLLSELGDEAKFKTFYFLLCKDSLIAKEDKSHIDELYEKSKQKQLQISNEFYNNYKKLRWDLFAVLKKHNSEISQMDLFTKAQKILDRLIFICFCEGRYLLPRGTFNNAVEASQKSFLRAENPLWAELKGLFRAIDEGHPPMQINGYNGGLFREDPILDKLNIPNKALISFKCLWSYDYNSDLNVNILGHILEQSIADIEKIKAELDGTKTEKQRSKRKTDGIYYTPAYITRYMVENTVGAWLDEKRKKIFAGLPEFIESDLPQKKKGGAYTYSKTNRAHFEAWEEYRKELLNIKTLDPACGSGAFLTEVLSHLLKEGGMIDDEYKKLQLFDRPMLKDTEDHPNYAKWKNDILPATIYGVDKNSESVEITRLSLWLNSAQPDEKLRDLDNNIKVGNSLISDPTIARDCPAFDWQGESGFAGIMSDGGFDVIIGNPPYGVLLNEDEKQFLSNWDCNVPDFESCIYFLSKGLQLLNSNGIISFIIPNTFLSNLFGVNYRKWLLENHEIMSIVDLSSDPIFEDASVRTCILTVRKSNIRSETAFLTIDNNSKEIRLNSRISHLMLADSINNWLRLFEFCPTIDNLVKKIQSISLPLSNLCEVSQGLIPYDKYQGHTELTIKNRIWHSEIKKDDTYKKELQGEDVKKYCVDWNGKTWISYGDWLAAPRDPKFFTSPRLLIREIVNSTIYCAYTDEEFYNTPSIINIISKTNGNILIYLLGIINSKLIKWYHINTSPKAKKGLFPKILVNDVRNLPVACITIEQQNLIAARAEQLIKLNAELYIKLASAINYIKSKYNIDNVSKKIKSLHHLDANGFLEELKKAKNKKSLTHEQNLLDWFEQSKSHLLTLISNIQKLEKKLDKEVYALYGLTTEDIEIIERQG